MVKFIREKFERIIMLSLFQDLFIRMLVIVAVFDFILWWILGGQSTDTVFLLFVVEMIAITISLWYDLKVRKWRKSGKKEA
jgi:hypothetical protein